MNMMKDEINVEITFRMFVNGMSRYEDVDWATGGAGLVDETAGFTFATGAAAAEEESASISIFNLYENERLL